MEILCFRVPPGTHLGRMNERGNSEIALIGKNGRTVERILFECRNREDMLAKLKEFKLAGKPTAVEK